MTGEKVKRVTIDDESGRRTIGDGFRANRSKRDIWVTAVIQVIRITNSDQAHEYTVVKGE